MIGLHYCYIYLIHTIILVTKLCEANPLLGQNVQPAQKGEFPFIVSLTHGCLIMEKENHFCGGALISKRHVLTSAHCVKNTDLRCVIVIADTVDFESGRILGIKSATTYDDWARDNNIIPEYMDNDLVILTLLQDVDDIVPGVISKLKRQEVIGQKVIAIGWGLIDESKKLSPKSLQEAYMEALNQTQYEHNAMQLFNTTKTLPLNTYFTWASPPAVTTCGDSGGPLLLASNNEIVGINESGCKIKEPEKNPNAMSVHVVADYYRDFIEFFVNSV